MLGDPEQLCSNQATDEPCICGVNRARRQSAARDLTREERYPDERTDGDENTEAGDLEAPDAEQDRIDRLLLLRRTAGTARRMGVPNFPTLRRLHQQQRLETLGIDRPLAHLRLDGVAGHRVCGLAAG